MPVFDVPVRSDIAPWHKLQNASPVSRIKSARAAVRHQPPRTSGCLSNKTALAMVFKLVNGAQKRWRYLDVKPLCQN